MMLFADDKGPHSAHRDMRSACGNGTGAGKNLLYSVATAIHIPETAKNVPSSNRIAPDEQLPEKENLIRFRYKNTDLDPMKNWQKQGA